MLSGNALEEARLAPNCRAEIGLAQVVECKAQKLDIGQTDGTARR
jgi:hypothetical protein